ncbi:hypothetical protein HQ585_18845 [candidate division KSB1 bacterium]|nr:hypothetical protein [candidate division KSB1 bacterium]
MQKSCLLNFSTTNPKKLNQQLQKIGFESIGNHNQILMTDESMTLLISQSEEPTLNLVYYTDDLNKETQRLASKGIDHHYHVHDNSYISFQSIEGLNVEIRCMQDAPKTMIHFLALHTLDEDAIFNPTSYPNQKIGIFNELDLPTNDLEKSKIYWENLGFNCIEYHHGPYPWGVFSDGMMHIGVHETDDFKHPMITYSAADMKERVKKLRDESDIKITKFKGAHRSLHKYQLQMNQACQFFLFSF